MITKMAINDSRYLFLRIYLFCKRSPSSLYQPQTFYHYSVSSITMIEQVFIYLQMCKKFNYGDDEILKKMLIVIRLLVSYRGFEWKIEKRLASMYAETYQMFYPR